MLAEYRLDPQTTRTRLYFEMVEDVFADEEDVELVDRNLQNFLPLLNLGETRSAGTQTDRRGAAMKKLVTVLVVIAVVVIVFLILGPFYIVQEGEQAVVIRFGEIVSTTNDAGLKIKTPFVDNVVKYPERTMSWDGQPRLFPTAEQQFIYVDTTARWRIVDR